MQAQGCYQMRMGHSIESFHGKSAIIHDLDLLAVIAFAVDVLQDPTGFPHLGALTEAWRSIPRGYGPGVIDLKLEELLQTPAHVEEFAALLDRISARLKEYPGTIPAAWLNSSVGAASRIAFNDFKASFAIEAVEKLRALVAATA